MTRELAVPGVELNARVDQLPLTKQSQLVCAQSVVVVLQECISPWKMIYVRLDLFNERSICFRLGPSRVSSTMSRQYLRESDIAVLRDV